MNGQVSNEERERFFSRLSTVPGIELMPSIGQWILVKTDLPSDLARKINRRTESGTVSVPRHVPGAIRIPVRDPKLNEELFQVLRELCQKKEQVRYYHELRATAE
ncbi:MAG: hypothetical protein WD226_00270 [Planctomycetota bacterium]